MASNYYLKKVRKPQEDEGRCVTCDAASCENEYRNNSVRKNTVRYIHYIDCECATFGCPLDYDDFNWDINMHLKRKRNFNFILKYFFMSK
jgi:hypothetical protein